jgi:transposase-like protein
MRQVDFRSLLESISRLTARQRESLRIALQMGDMDAVAAVIDELMAVESRCPHCGTARAIRWGSASGLPRFRCKACRRTFNPLTGTQLAGLRRRSSWAPFAESLRRGETLEEAAERCGIHRNTAHRWRHRFLQEPTATLQALCGIAEADETLVLRSAKGQPDVRKAWGRPARRRGGKARHRGRSPENVSVFVARDRSGATVDAVFHKFDAAEVGRTLEPVLDRDSILCTDGLNLYRTVAAELGVRHERLTALRQERVRGPFHIQNVNSYHSRWRGWMRRFRGVSTRYLENYLGWFRTLDMQPPMLRENFMLRAALQV